MMKTEKNKASGFNFPSRFAFLALVTLVTLFSSCSSDSGDSDNTFNYATGLVETTSGTVYGKVVTADGREVHAFLGIPFGESTAGENRWRDPIPKAPASEVIEATEFGPACPQTLNPPYTPSETSEDCLNLNIWRRADMDDSGPRPVMVWIHGGSFLSGGGSQPVYDGAWLASAANLVVVSLNYRLGALGFLAGIHELEGNYGIKDQQLALQWVRDNISHFGGDPNQVTLFGESAGAMSVGLHSLSIPSSNGLFRCCIMQSNPFGIPYKSVAEAGTEATLLETALGCGGKEIDCLRELAADDIVKEQSDASIEMSSLMGLHLAGFLVWAPVIDGIFLVENPTVSAGAGELKVPTILGTTHDEGVLFVNEIARAFGGRISAATYASVLTLIFGSGNTPGIIARYGINLTGDNSENLANITTDYLFGCANRFVASHAASDLYAYEFNENSINVWPDDVNCDGKACHGDDIPFTFHTDVQMGIHFTDEQTALSNEMMGYWGAFAAHLNPNMADFPSWPIFTPSHMDYMILVTPELYTAVNPVPNCKFWDQIGYNLKPPSQKAAARILATLGR